MSKNYIFNGEIFLRKNPCKVDLQEYIDEIEDFKYQIEDELNESHKYELEERLYELIKEYNYLKGMNGIDYAPMLDFYFLNTNGVNHQIINSANTREYEEYKDIKDINKNYISLVDFLENSEFIGRKFYRTKSIISPSISEAISYMEEDNDELEIIEYIALYKTNDLLLIKRIYKNKDFYLTNYDIVDKRYIQDNNLEYYGKVYEEYKDKYNLYMDILREISNYKKPKGYSL